MSELPQGLKCRKGDWDKLLKWAKSSWCNGVLQGWAGGVQGNPRGVPEQALSVEGSRTRSRQRLSARFGFECWPRSEDEFVLYVLGQLRSRHENPSLLGLPWWHEGKAL